MKTLITLILLALSTTALAKQGVAILKFTAKGDPGYSMEHLNLYVFDNRFSSPASNEAAVMPIDMENGAGTLEVPIKNGFNYCSLYYRVKDSSGMAPPMNSKGFPRDLPFVLLEGDTLTVDFTYAPHPLGYTVSVNAALGGSNTDFYSFQLADPSRQEILDEFILYNHGKDILQQHAQIYGKATDQVKKAIEVIDGASKNWKVDDRIVEILKVDEISQYFNIFSRLFTVKTIHRPKDVLQAAKIASQMDLMPCLKGVPDSVLSSSYHFAVNVYKYMSEISRLGAQTGAGSASLATDKEVRKELYANIKQLDLPYFRSKLLWHWYLFGSNLAEDVEQDRSYLQQVLMEPYRSFMLDRELSVDYIFADMNGEPVRLSDFKGKLVLIDFWFTGCSGCMQINPVVRKAEKEIMESADGEVVFLSVSVDMDPAVFKGSVAGGKYTTEHSVNLNTGGVGRYHQFLKDHDVFSYPTLVLLDRNGKPVKGALPEIRADYEGFLDKVRSNL